MSTIKQEQAVGEIVENGGNVSKAMREVGYSKETAKTPKKLTNSIGYKELVNKYLPKRMILKALEDDIRDKPRFRHQEIGLALKVQGMLSDKIDITSGGKVISGFNYLTPKQQATESNIRDKTKKDE